MSTPAELHTANAAVETPGHSLRRAAMLTAGFGLAHAALFVLAYWLLANTPGPRSSNEEVIAFFSRDNRRFLIVAGLYVMPFSGIAFIWFIVALRMWIAGSTRRENVLLSNVQLVCGIVYVTLLFAGAAAEATVAGSIVFAQGVIDPLMARLFPLYGSTLLIVFAMRMAAMFVLTTTNIGRAAGILPRWFVVVGYGVAVFLLLSASYHGVLALVFPAWLTILCTLSILRARRIPPDLVLPTDATRAPAQRPGKSP